MEDIIAALIGPIVTTDKLFPRTDFENRGKSCLKNGTNYLLEKIYATENKNEIALRFIMNVFALYLNTLHKCVIHHPHKMKIYISIVNLVSLFLNNRHIIIKINKYTLSKVLKD